MHWTHIGDRLAGDVVVLDVKGHMTLAEPESLLFAYVQRMMQDGRRKFLVNLQHLAFIDSVGIGEIVRSVHPSRGERWDAEAVQCGASRARSSRGHAPRYHHQDVRRGGRRPPHVLGRRARSSNSRGRPLGRGHRNHQNEARAASVASRQHQDGVADGPGASGIRRTIHDLPGRHHRCRTATVKVQRGTQAESPR